MAHLLAFLAIQDNEKFRRLFGFDEKQMLFMGLKLRIVRNCF